jgi:putative ABC transport system permease protein
MRTAFSLAARYLRFHRRRTLIVVFAVASTIALPLAVELLVAQYDRELWSRAHSTPLVLGAKGNRFDLVLASLYFRASRLDPVPSSASEEIRDSGLAAAFPIAGGFSSRGIPIVGAGIDYLDWRGLVCASGRRPSLLGEAVVGAEAASELDLEPGDFIIPDQVNLYDVSKALPVKLRVTGILEARRSPDDFAIFCDVRTVWILEGLGHGHDELTAPESAPFVLERDGTSVTASAALDTLIEITPENAASFHFHGDPNTFPVDAVIVVPRDLKSATILEARYRFHDELRIVDPRDVVGDLTGFVFRVKRFFDLVFLVVGVSTVLFLGVVVLLSMRIRAGEFRTLDRMGAARGLVARLIVAELAIVLALGGLIAGAIAGTLLIVSPAIFRIL